jgi:hypothetical protein
LARAASGARNGCCFTAKRTQVVQPWVIYFIRPDHKYFPSNSTRLPIKESQDNGLKNRPARAPTDTLAFWRETKPPVAVPFEIEIPVRIKNVREKFFLDVIQV